jgi:hypothetical protein
MSRRKSKDGPRQTYSHLSAEPINYDRAVKVSNMTGNHIHQDTIEWLVADEIANEKNITAYNYFQRANIQDGKNVFWEYFENALTLLKKIGLEQKGGFESKKQVNSKVIIEFIRCFMAINVAHEEMFKINALIEPIITREAKRLYYNSHGFNPTTRRGKVNEHEL